MDLITLLAEVEADTFFFLFAPVMIGAAGYIMGSKKDIGTGFIIGGLTAFLTAMMFNPIYIQVSYPNYYGFNIVEITSGILMIFGLIYYILAGQKEKGGRI